MHDKMFFIIQFIIVWIVWIIFADKKRWREFLPIGFFAAATGSMVDTVATHYGWWKYHGHLIYFTRILDNLGIYIVTPYLFLQYLPKRKTFWRILVHWFLWSTGAIGIEWLHIKTGHMVHGHSWSMTISYLTDYILFALFYGYYKLFRFERLSEETP